jgi:hypothetical protein
MGPDKRGDAELIDEAREFEDIALGATSGADPAR